MQLRSIRDSSLEELNQRTYAFVAACGYERRCPAISRRFKSAERKVAICFDEWVSAIARQENEVEFKLRGFELIRLGGNDSSGIQRLVAHIYPPTSRNLGALAFDISSMTRAWHGGIVRQLRTMESSQSLEVFFCYVPAKFKKPTPRPTPNEFVEPVQGFASLSSPELPVAAIIGLGYERERALGLQQLLDPQSTMLLVPKAHRNDPFFREVLRSNRDIISRNGTESTFEYSIEEPAATFATLASVVSGLRERFRVVLVSLGPKIFGLLCFLLATRFSDVSVWRVSSGVHGRPRDADADEEKITVCSTIWEPD